MLLLLLIVRPGPVDLAAAGNCRTKAWDGLASITDSATRSDNGAKPFGSGGREDDGVISIGAARGVEQRGTGIWT